MVNKQLYLGDNRPLRNVQEVFRNRDQPHPTHTWAMLKTSVGMISGLLPNARRVTEED